MNNNCRIYARLIMMASLSGSLVSSATTVWTKTVVCAECGTTNTIHVITSISSFGLMDLDTRPAPPARYNIQYQLQVCGQCRYAADDLTRPLKSDAAKRYLSEINRLGQNTLSDNYHIAAELIQLENDDWLTAAFLDVRAAWVEDDRKGGEKRAEAFRGSAIRRLERHIKTDNGSPSLMLLLSDLYRRTGRFDDAENMARQAYAVSDKKTFLSICAKQEIENCHRRNPLRVQAVIPKDVD